MNKAPINPLYEDESAFLEYANSRVFSEDGSLISSDEKLRNDLVKKNLKLVPFVIDKLYNKITDLNLIRDDLLQEGYIGLIEALPRFEPSMGFKFSTYVVFWVRQQINRFLLNNKNAPHIPCHVRIAYNKLLKESKHNEMSLKDLIQNKEVLASHGISEKMANNIKASMDNRVVISLAETNHDSDVELEDKLEDNKDSLELTTDKNKLLAVTKKALLSLSDRERNILLLRYNIIESVKPKTNAKID